MRHIFSAALTVLALLLLTSCARGANRLYNSDDSDRVHIGVVYPMEQNDLNTYLHQGIELAVAEVNKSGGVLGKPIEIIWQDDKNDGNKALEIAQKFCKEGITAVIGHWGSGICYTVEDVYEENQTVMIMPCATSRSVFEKNYDYVFRMCGNSYDYASAIADDIVNRGYDNIAICYSDDVYGLDFANHVENELMNRGISVIDRITNLSFANADKIAERWNAFGCEGVVVGNVIPSSIEIIGAVRSMSKEYPIWGADNFQRSNFISLLGGDTSNMYRVENDYSSMNSEFLENFYNQNGCSPDIFAVAGYDAVKLISYAMNACGTIKGSEVAEYLSSLKDYPSVSGNISYDPVSQEFTGHRVLVNPVTE